MDLQQTIDAIKRRRAEFWDRQIVGTVSDPLVYSEAQCARIMADEYESLLKEIERA